MLAGDPARPSVREDAPQVPCGYALAFLWGPVGLDGRLGARPVGCNGRAERKQPVL